MITLGTQFILRYKAVGPAALKCSLASEQSRTVAQSCGIASANSYADIITDHVGRVFMHYRTVTIVMWVSEHPVTIRIFKNIPQKSSGVRSYDIAGTSTAFSVHEVLVKFSLARISANSSLLFHLFYLFYLFISVQSHMYNIEQPVHKKYVIYQLKYANIWQKYLNMWKILIFITVILYFLILHL